MREKEEQEKKELAKKREMSVWGNVEETLKEWIKEIKRFLGI